MKEADIYQTLHYLNADIYNELYNDALLELDRLKEEIIKLKG